MVGISGTDLPSLRQTISRSLPSETGSTERVRKLNALLLSTPHTLCLHRARSYTAVFSETEDEPTTLRSAKAFARALEDMPAYIDEGELVVGGQTCRLRAAGVLPEAQGTWLRRDIDGLPHREYDPFEVSPEQIKEIKQIMVYWRGKTLQDIWDKACPPEIVAKVSGSGWADCFMLMTHGYHFTPAWEPILANGVSWYESQVRQALAKVDPLNPEQMGKDHFYKALLLVTQAIKGFANKYAKKARELAAQETNPIRKDELIGIAETVDRVPYYGARSFREAIQAVWFVMALMHIEGTGPVYSLGRVDQYLYPFYKTDISKGILTPQQAQELIELLFIKLTGNVMLWSTDGAKCSPGYKPTQAITLGGVDGRGKDASNELTYLFLDAAESVRTIQPDIALLWDLIEMPYRLKMRAAEINALGFGVPKLFPIDAIKTQLMELGFSLEEARVGWIQGCSEPYGPGCKMHGHSAGATLNLPMALETVLYNGRKRTPNQLGSGKLVGVETGEPRKFGSFEDFMNALKTQIAQQIRDGHIATSWVSWVEAQYYPLMQESLYTDDCIGRGLPACAGGAKINVGPGVCLSGGVGNVADSLAVIKKLVFEDKKVSMGQLLKAIDANFVGYETLQETFINEVPKYGNDIDYVDDLAAEVWQFAGDEAKKYIGFLGNRDFCSEIWPMSNSFQGTKVWATPDGRKAGTPLSNHFGPMDGRDVSGPTANINSVTKLGIERYLGAVHNMYLVNVKNDDDLHRIIDLMDLFASRHGSHLQFNCQDKEVFIDAQKHPGKYRGLMVRVAGYVAYFVELPKGIQDQIIGRTSLHF